MDHLIKEALNFLSQSNGKRNEFIFLFWLWMMNFGEECLSSNDRNEHATTQTIYAKSCRKLFSLLRERPEDLSHLCKYPK